MIPTDMDSAPYARQQSEAVWDQSKGRYVYKVLGDICKDCYDKGK